MYGEEVTLAREGVQSHTIYLLEPNTIYYLKVRGQNGCMPGVWSNVMEFTTDNSIYYKYSQKSITKARDLIFSKTITPTPTPKNSSVLGETNQANPVPTPSPKNCFLWWCW